ncbi:hypothetical protein FOZ63_008503, partial [Perkinsus olseni]
MATPVKAVTEPARTPSSTWTNLESVLSERKKARSYRGRLQGQLNRLREQLNTLIVREEDPDSVEAEEELQKRESDLQKALADAIERCTHLDLVVDKTIRQRAVTEAESFFANDDEDEDAESFDGLPFFNGPVEEDNVNSVPDKAKDAIAPPNPQESSPRMLRDVKFPVQDTDGSPAMPQEAQERVRNPPPCRPIEVSKLTVPKLVASYRLKSHFSMLEGLMVEIGAGKILPGQGYSPYATTRILCYNKLIESFGDCLDVVDAANEIAESSGYQWLTIRQELLAQFAQRDMLKTNYDDKLTKLKFGGVQRTDEFLRHSSTIYHLYMDVFKGDSSERRRLVDKIMSKLPSDIRVRVIDKIKGYMPVNNDSELESQDWELILPFERVGKFASRSIVGIIRQTCRTMRDASVVENPSSARSATNLRPDLIRQIVDRDVQSLSDWAKKYARVWGLCGKGCRSLDKVKALGANGLYKATSRR